MKETLSQLDWSEELLATIFHQLRTPVTSINGYSAILLTGELGKLNLRQRGTVQRIQDICRSITTLTGNLLTLTKSSIKRLHLSKEFVRLDQVAEEALDSLRGEIRRKRLRLVTHLPAGEIRFWGDRADFFQVFLNLLSNAVKFTPAKGRVALRIVQRKKRLLIEVSDTGVGIAKGDMPRIFEEFFYINHPEVGATLGSGLGLSIVRRIVDSYKGKIAVSSQVHHGTRFRLTFQVVSEQKVMSEFFEEAWFEAKRLGWMTGLLLIQMRAFSPRGSISVSLLPRAMVAFEEILQRHLRKEDRIFRLPQSRLLAILVRVDPTELPLLFRRIERVLENERSIKHFCEEGIRWRIISLQTPRRGGSPERFLNLARQRLKQSWEKGGVPWD